MRILLLFVLFLVSSSASARYCPETIVIDEVTEIAYGNRGVPYNGYLKCYRDEEKTHLLFEGLYEKGVPQGTHIVYRGGKPSVYIKYQHGKRAGYYFDPDGYGSGKPIIENCAGRYDSWCVRVFR